MSEAVSAIIQFVQGRLAKESMAVAMLAEKIPANERAGFIMGRLESCLTPDCQELLEQYPEITREAANLAASMVAVACLTAAAFPSFAQMGQQMSNYLLVALGLVLDPWRFGGQLVTDGEVKPVQTVLDSLGGSQEVQRSLLRLLLVRGEALAQLVRVSNRPLVVPYAAVLSAVEAAMVLFDDGVMRPEEFYRIEKLREERSWAFRRFLAMANLVCPSIDEPMGQVQCCLLNSLGILADDDSIDTERDDPTAADIVELFPLPAERVWLVTCLALVLTASGPCNLRQEQFFYPIAAALGIGSEQARALLTTHAV